MPAKPTANLPFKVIVLKIRRNQCPSTFLIGELDMWR